MRFIKIFQAIPKICLLVFITLVVKLILLPFSQTINADAVSRIFSSQKWMENPEWVTSSVWAPFHFYIHGFSLMFWNNTIYTPKLVTILFSTATLLPFYFLTKREFNQSGAFIASIFLAICPILFHNSFLALSETPYLFFLALSLNTLSKGVKENSILYLLLAGLIMSIASGIRYEAWVMTAIMSFILLFTKKWKHFLFFNLTAALFPIYWLLSNYLETGDPLFSIQGTYHWNFEIMGNNENLDFESYLKRIWFFPFSWIIAIGIPTGFLVLKTIFISYTKKSRNLHFISLSLPFFIMFLFYQYNTLKGSLLLQHRYIGTLVILSLPFIAVYFKELSRKKIKLVWLFCFLTIGLSFIYNTAHVKPLPRLSEQSSVTIINKINQYKDENSSLIIDFIGWDKSYFIALQSQVDKKNILLIEGAKYSNIPFDMARKKLNNYSNGIILLKKNSKLQKALKLNEYNITSEKMYEDKSVVVLKWIKN
jgi:4-amino-4-deoxy-L-arabinose transferase-like glycosyltransferase